MAKNRRNGGPSVKAQEEVGLEVELIEQFYVYSDPNRDPRQTHS